MAVVVSVIAVLIALGCFIAIAMSDARSQKKKPESEDQQGHAGSQAASGLEPRSEAVDRQGI